MTDPRAARVTITLDPPSRSPRGWTARLEGSDRVGRGLTMAAALADLEAPEDRPGKGQTPPYMRALADDEDPGTVSDPDRDPRDENDS